MGEMEENSCPILLTFPTFLTSFIFLTCPTCPISLIPLQRFLLLEARIRC